MDDGSLVTAISVINHHNWLVHNLLNMFKGRTSEFLSAALWNCGESSKMLKHSIWICFIYASRNKSVSISYRLGNIYSCRYVMLTPSIRAFSPFGVLLHDIWVASVSKQHRHICNYCCEITNWCAFTFPVDEGNRLQNDVPPSNISSMKAAQTRVSPRN